MHYPYFLVINSSSKTNVDIPNNTFNISRSFSEEIQDNISDFTARVKNSLVSISNKGTVPVINVVDTLDNFDIFLAYPDLDQTVCGDCYAFAVSTAVSDSLRLAIHKYNITNNTNIKFPLNEWVNWFFTLQGATYKELPGEDVSEGQAALRFDLPDYEIHKYPVLNNISPLGLAILEPDYDFFGYKGLVGGSICTGGNPALALEVLLAWNFLPNECRLASIPPIFPNWTKARYVSIEDATDEMIKQCDVQGNRVYLCPTTNSPNEVLARDECGNVFNGGCPVTYMDDYLHKFIPILLTGFNCDEIKDTQYCFSSERIAALYFMQIPYSNFNYQINGFKLICQRNSTSLTVTYGSSDNISNIIKSYIYQHGPIIINMRISSSFFGRYTSTNSNHEKSELFSMWVQVIFIILKMLQMEYLKVLHLNTYPVFSLPFGNYRGIHSVNIVGWG